MKQSDTSAHLVPTWSAHSSARSLVVALALALAPFLAVLAVTYPTTAVAFLAGALVAVATALTIRFRRQARGNRPLLTVGLSP